MAKVQKDVFRALLLKVFGYEIAQWEVRFKSHDDAKATSGGFSSKIEIKTKRMPLAPLKIIKFAMLLSLLWNLNVQHTL